MTAEKFLAITKEEKINHILELKKDYDAEVNTLTNLKLTKQQAEFYLVGREILPRNRQQ